MSPELTSSLGLGWAKPNRVLAGNGVPQTPPITDRAPGSYRPPPLLEPQQDLAFPNGLLLEHPETPSTHQDPSQQSQELRQDGNKGSNPICALEASVMGRLGDGDLSLEEMEVKLGR